MKQSDLITVRLVNMLFYAYHGVLEAEQKLGNRYELDVEFKVEASRAAYRDNVNDTIDYGQVSRLINNTIQEEQFRLLETIAWELAQRLLRHFPALEQVAVKIRKRNPPIDGLCDYAEAEYAASRT